MIGQDWSTGPAYLNGLSRLRCAAPSSSRAPCQRSGLAQQGPRDCLRLHPRPMRPRPLRCMGQATGWGKVAGLPDSTLSGLGVAGRVPVPNSHQEKSVPSSDLCILREESPGGLNFLDRLHSLSVEMYIKKGLGKTVLHFEKRKTLSRLVAFQSFW